MGRIEKITVAGCLLLATCASDPGQKPELVWNVGLNKSFNEIAQVEPTFGGIYVAESQAVVLLGTDPAKEGELRSASAAFLAEHNLSDRSLSFGLCSYSWPQLTEAADVIVQSSCMEACVGSVDIDEIKNRVDLGIYFGMEESVTSCLRSVLVREEMVTMSNYVKGGPR